MPEKSARLASNAVLIPKDSKGFLSSVLYSTLNLGITTVPSVCIQHEYNQSLIRIEGLMSNRKFLVKLRCKSGLAQQRYG